MPIYRRSTTIGGKYVYTPIHISHLDAHRCDDDDDDDSNSNNNNNNNNKRQLITTKDVYYIYGKFAYNMFRPKRAIVR